MLVLSPTYRQALINSGLDPETYPISKESSWDSDSIKFDSDLASISFSDVDFSAISSLNTTLGASMKSMVSSALDTSTVKGSSASVNSDVGNTATLKSTASTLNTLTQVSTTNLQVGAYTNTISSDTGTGLNASGTDQSTLIKNDVATTLATKVKAQETALKTSSKETEITSKSYVITLR